MARVALLVTVLAAVAYISQAIPVPENVEDEQFKSKEIFDQVQPESKEILDQVQSESKEILDQNQSKSEEILDQIQSKSEENLDQSDDTLKNELEDSKNKDWRDHYKEHLQKLEEILKKKLELLENKNQWKNKGIERKIEKIQQIQQRTRRNSQFVPIDIPNVNDIEETFKDQVFNMEEVKQFSSLVQNKINKVIANIPLIIEKFIAQIGEKDEIREKVQKMKETFKEIIETSKYHEQDIKDRAKDLFKNAFKNFEKLKENGIAKDFFRIGFDAPIIFHNIIENIKKEGINLISTIISAKINKFEDIKQKITEIGTIIVEKAKDYAKEGIKAIESRIGNLLKETEERFNDKVKPKIGEVFEEDKVGEIINNISKKFEELNNAQQFQKFGLSIFKRD